MAARYALILIIGTAATPARRGGPPGRGRQAAAGNPRGPGGRLLLFRLPVHVLQRARVVRELAGVEHLDAGVLLTVERGHDRRGGPGLAAELERLPRAVEPQAQMELVSGRLVVR